MNRALRIALAARGARALSWKAPANRVAELFPTSDAARARNADADAVYVVTGASGGIGRAVVDKLVERTAGTIYACARDPSRVVETARVRPVKLDLQDDDSLAALPEAVGGRVDVLFNAVGMLHRGNSSPERSIDKIDRAWLMESFDVNVAGPLLATQALRPALDAGRKGPRPPSLVASLSARVGSISDNGLGGWYSYRASKAALNMATKTAAIELKRQGTICVALHPGTTDTGLSKPFQKRVAPEKLFPAAFVADQLLDIVDGLTMENTGGFFAWDGESIEY